jgi:CO/xanthine dehydrogenase Mo-binding subunit
MSRRRGGKDPVEYRAPKSPRAKAVLDLVAAKGWARSRRQGRGVSVPFGFGSYIAEAAEVAVDKDGQVQVKRATVPSMRTGGNPIPSRRRWKAGSFGLSAALYGRDHLKDGGSSRALDSYRRAHNEAPQVEVHIVARRPRRHGEPGTAAIAPAVVNAIRRDRQRLRKLPIDSGALKSS